MSLDSIRQDADAINRFCASRGYGSEIRDHLLQRAKDRNQGFDRLRECETRFTQVTDQQRQQWRLVLNEILGLF